MNQKEAKARDKFRKASLGKIRIHLIENMVSDGMADSICINRKGCVFWIEFKANEWPKRDSTLPLRTVFEKGQIPFLKEWDSWNGKGFVLIQYSDEFYLLNPSGEKDLREATKAELVGAAIKIGLSSIIEYLENLE